MLVDIPSFEEIPKSRKHAYGDFCLTGTKGIIAAISKFEMFQVKSDLTILMISRQKGLQVIDIVPFNECIWRMSYIKDTSLLLEMPHDIVIFDY